MNFIRNHKKIVYFGLKVFHALPVSKMIDGSFSEIAALNDVFSVMKQQANISTPNWDELEERFSSRYTQALI